MKIHKGIYDAIVQCRVNAQCHIFYKYVYTDIDFYTIMQLFNSIIERYSCFV